MTERGPTHGRIRSAARAAMSPERACVDRIYTGGPFLNKSHPREYTTGSVVLNMKPNKDLMLLRAVFLLSRKISRRPEANVCGIRGLLL